MKTDELRIQELQTTTTRQAIKEWRSSAFQPTALCLFKSVQASAIRWRERRSHGDALRRVRNYVISEGDLSLQSQILREAVMETQFAHSDPPVYSVRRTPTLVCPYCKRAVMSFIDIIDGKPFSIYRCKEHGDVVAIWSEVVNEY